MVSVGLMWLVTSAVLFCAVLVTVQVERKRGQRFLLSGLRGRLDSVAAAIGRRIVSAWEHFVKYIVQLGWYYGLHSFLQAVLKTLVTFYEKIESVFERNRQRTKRLREEKRQAIEPTQSHLTEMAQYKADNALTPAQQRKLKDRQLKGD